MGMFDYVKYEMPCPKCGLKVNNFQTKDTGCDLEKVPYWHTDTFYGSCDNCDVWIEFFLKENAKPFIPIESYRMEARENNSSGKLIFDSEEK